MDSKCATAAAAIEVDCFSEEEVAFAVSGGGGWCKCDSDFSIKLERKKERNLFAGQCFPFVFSAAVVDVCGGDEFVVSAFIAAALSGQWNGFAIQ